MPLGKTPILQNDLMAQNDSNKFLLFNDAIVKLEDSVQRANFVPVGGNTNVTLTETQLLNFGVQIVQAASVPHTLTIPTTVGSPVVTTNRMFTVINTSGQITTVTHGGAGSTVQLPSGEGLMCYADGTDIIPVAGAGVNANAISIQEDLTTIVGSVDEIAFDSADFSVTNPSGSRALINLADGAGAVPLQNAGSQVQAAPTAINVVGNGATASTVGTVGTIDVPGTTVRANGGTAVPAVNTPPTDIDFVNGTNVTMSLVDNLDGTVTMTVSSSGGTAAVPVQKDGTQIVAAPTALNFTGTAVAVTDVGGIATIAVTAATPVPVQKDGVEIVADPTVMNFTGAGVAVTDVAGVATVNIAGGGGGASVATQKDGSAVVAATDILNFTGTGVALSNPSGDTTAIDIPGAGVAWSGARLTKTATQALTLATDNAVTWETVDRTVGTWYAGGNPTRLTVPIGVTRVRLAAAVDTGNATGKVRAFFHKNGSLFAGGGSDTVDANGVDTNMLVSDVIDVSPADYFELIVNPDDTGHTVASTVSETWFSIEAIEGIAGTVSAPDAGEKVYDFAIDGALNQVIIIDVNEDEDVFIEAKGITFAAGDRFELNMSSDGGATPINGAGTYDLNFVQNNSGSNVISSTSVTTVAAGPATATATSLDNVFMEVRGASASAFPTYITSAYNDGSISYKREVHRATAIAENAIILKTANGNNMTAGQIFVTRRKAGGGSSGSVPILLNGVTAVNTPTALDFVGSAVKQITDESGVATIKIDGAANFGQLPGSTLLSTYDFGTTAAPEIIVPNADQYDEIQFILDAPVFGDTLIVQFSEDGTVFDTATTNYTSRFEAGTVVGVATTRAGIEAWSSSATATRFGSISVRNMALPVQTELTTRAAGTGAATSAFEFSGAYELPVVHKAVKLLTESAGNITAGKVYVVGVNYKGTDFAQLMGFKGARLEQQIAQGFSASATANVSFTGGAQFDDGSFFNGSDALVIPAGVTRVRATGSVQMNTTGGNTDFELAIQIDGTTVAANVHDGTSALAHGTQVDTGVISVIEGQSITLQVTTEAGGAFTALTDLTFLSIEDVSNMGGFGAGVEVIGSVDLTSFTGPQDFTDLGEYSSIILFGNDIDGDNVNNLFMTVSADNGTTFETSYDRGGVIGATVDYSTQTDIALSFDTDNTSRSVLRLDAFNKAVPTIGERRVVGSTLSNSDHVYFTQTAASHNAIRIDTAGTMVGGTLYVLGVRDNSNGVKNRLTIVNELAATAARTMSGADEGIYLLTNNVTSYVYTVVQDSVANLPIGTTINFEQGAAGQITFSAGAGATIRSAGLLTSRTTNSICILTKVAANTWTLGGDITP